MVKFNLAHEVLHYVSFSMAVVCFIASVSMAVAFLRHARHNEPLVRWLAWGIVGVTASEAMRCFIWDIYLRVEQRVHGFGREDLTTAYPGFDRMDFYILYYMALLASYACFARLFHMTIPQRDRSRWPWWKAPFYPDCPFVIPFELKRRKS